MKHVAAIVLLAFAMTVLADGNTKTSAYVCSLTKKKTAACCCTKTEDGKLYCTLAKKTVASCCCKTATAK